MSTDAHPRSSPASAIAFAWRTRPGRSRNGTRDPPLDVSRLGEAYFDAGVGAGECWRRVPRLIVVLAPYRLAVLAKRVLDGLERLARVAEKEFVREDLPDARLCAVPPSVPVLVDERADAGVDACAARELDDMLDVSQRPKEQDILGTIQPGVFRNLGAPSRDHSPNGRATPALEPLCRILAVRLDEGAGNGIDEVGVPGHVALPCEGERAVALMDSAQSPLEAPSVHRPRLRMATTRFCDERRDPKTSRFRGCARDRDGKPRKAGRTRKPVGGTVRRTCNEVETNDGRGPGRPANVGSSVRW